MAKISIIVPIYNEEKYLEECLDSIINQTIEDIEIICVNDGSTDSSKEIIDHYVSKDKRIKAVHKKNSGYGNSMNRGIEAATGEYIGVVESDDFIVSNMYESLYALTDNGKIDVVKGNFWDCYDEIDGSITKVKNEERRNMPTVESAFTIRQYPQLLWGHPSIWSAIYKRDFIEKNKIRFKEVKGAGWVDNPFFFDTLCKAQSIKWTSEPFYCYRKLNLESSSRGYDLALPFDRMIDNLGVLKNNDYNDEEILKFAYARALMYLCGAMEEEHYPQYETYAKKHMQEMLGQMNQDIIIDDFNLNDQKNFFKYRSPLTTIMPESTKILIYNWVPFDNPNKVGGGVTIYCKNLIETILRYRPDVTVYFLSSGWAYDISRSECYIRKIGNVFGERCKSFEIVNSPVPAPQDMLFCNPTLAFENKELRDTFKDFIDKFGPFGDIHFNNIEGLSLDVFSLKKNYPETKFVFSIHNYVPVCMTGFYFQRDKKENCNPNHTFEDCDKCINRKNYRCLSTEMIQRATYNHSDISYVNVIEWCNHFGFNKIDDKKKADVFVEFTKKATSALNENMDVILAVSERVREIAVANGMDANKVVTNYIGTKVADVQVRRSLAENNTYFKLAYLGSNLEYVEKGYPFLINALEKIKETIAKKIDLVLTTTTSGKDNELQQRLSKFHSVQIIHGYTHRDLSHILQGVDLGVIPVLWEDNLPQIAIEMVAMGVPVLCSDAGGASELCTSELFRFKHADEIDFITKIKYFVENRDKLEEYWKNHNGLTTMKMHLDVLQKIYELPEPSKAEITIDEYARMLEENEFLYRNIRDREPVIIRDGGAADEMLCQKENELGQMKRELDEMKKDRDYLQYCLDETRKSKTYKIGRAITFLPRKIRGEN